MAKPKRNDEPHPPNCFRFNLAGLIIFSLCLVAGGAFVTGKFFKDHQKPYAIIQRDKFTYTHEGAWGELLTQNIELERPVELVAAEVTSPSPQKWVFQGWNVAQVKALLVRAGLTAQQVDQALAPNRVSTEGNNTVFQPGEDFVFSLSPETRQKLYAELCGMGVNTHIDWPYVFPGDTITSVFTDARLNPDDAALLKKLVYRTGDATQLSDYEVLINKIPTVPRRIAMARVLSGQPTVLASLFIRPDSDLDKIAGYWGQMENVHSDDIRPLLESLAQLPNGGSVSLLYFLPPFARERLYTFPIPTRGDPNMDCQWTTFNFSNLLPDNRFNDTDHVARHLEKNYYRIDEPTRYGDVILLLNGKSECKHSAVYLADDLVFTKYGNNYTQPWIIVRIPDMLDKYPTLKAAFFRKRTS